MRKFGGSWSEAKLDLVEDYTRSYLRVMQRQEWCDLHYVDAFAGRGMQALKSVRVEGIDAEDLDLVFGDESERADTREFLVGSAMRAMRASAVSTRHFDRFLFIDVDRRSCVDLEKMIGSEFPGAQEKVEVICGEASTALVPYIARTNWTSTRALVFLDPYGLEVGWDLLVRLAATKACDVWYLFPLGGVIRMMTRDGQVPETWKWWLGRVFGTDGWYEEFYRPTGQQSLFGEGPEPVCRAASPDRVVAYVRQRLQTIFPAVSHAGILRNGKGAPLFALLLGVSNPRPTARKTAVRIADHLVKGLSQ